MSRGSDTCELAAELILLLVKSNVFNRIPYECTILLQF